MLLLQLWQLGVLVFLLLLQLLFQNMPPLTRGISMSSAGVVLVVGGVVVGGAVLVEVVTGATTTADAGATMSILHGFKFTTTTTGGTSTRSSTR